MARIHNPHPRKLHHSPPVLARIPQVYEPFRSIPTCKSQSLLRGRWAKIVVAIGIVAPPRGKRLGRPAGAEDGKRQDEQHRKTGTVEGAGDKVRVVPEDARAVVAQVELGEEAGDDLAEDDAGLAGVVGDIASVLNELWQVKL